MAKKEYFTYRESPDMTRCVIVPKNYDTFPFNTKEGGSYNLAPARVLGLTYVDYLRFIKAFFGDDVTVEGKGSYYPVAYWRKGKNLYTWLDLLNAKLNLAVMTNYDNNK